MEEQILKIFQNLGVGVGMMDIPVCPYSDVYTYLSVLMFCLISLDRQNILLCNIFRLKICYNKWSVASKVYGHANSSFKLIYIYISTNTRTDRIF